MTISAKGWMMDDSYRIANSAELPSPSLVFYEEAIARNFDRALAIAGGPGRLRPHVKTHKTREIVGLSLARGITKFKCATIAEAEMVAGCGAPDVLLAYPLVGPNIARFLRLMERFPGTVFSAVADAMAPIRALDEAARARGLRAGLHLDLDTGLHRTGIAAGEEALELYALMTASKGLDARGLHLYDGQNHQGDLAERRAAVEAGLSPALELRDRLLALGLPAEGFVAGGTPSFPCHAAHPGLELSPGTCFLSDWSTLRSYPDLDFEPAALLFSRVVSVNKANSSFCLDLGYKAVASDPDKKDRGIVVSLEGAEPLLQNEEHWVFRLEGVPLPEPGAEVYVLMTHICPTSALHARAYVVNGDGRWYTEWEVSARDRVLRV